MNNANPDNEISLLFGEIWQYLEEYQNVRNMMYVITVGIIAAIANLIVFVKYFTVRREDFENMWKNVKDIEDKVEVEM